MFPVCVSVSLSFTLLPGCLSEPEMQTFALALVRIYRAFLDEVTPTIIG